MIAEKGVIQATSRVGANLVPLQVFVVAMAVRSIVTNGRSNGAAGASAVTDPSEQRGRALSTAERILSVVAAALMGIITHDANGNCRCQPCPCQAAMAVTTMTMAGKRGGEMTVRQLQGNNEATRM